MFFEDDADHQAQYGLYGARRRAARMEDPRALPDADAPPRPGRGAARCPGPRHAPARHVPGDAAQPAGATASAMPPPAASGRARSTRTPTSRASPSTSPTTRSTPDSSTTRERSGGRRTARRSASSPRPPWLQPDWLPAPVRDEPPRRRSTSTPHHVDRQAAAHRCRSARGVSCRGAAPRSRDPPRRVGRMARHRLHPRRDPRTRRRHRPRRPPLRRHRRAHRRRPPCRAAPPTATSSSRRPAAARCGRGIAEMYVGKALLPAARTTDPAAATLRVRVSDSGAIAVERIR